MKCEECGAEIEGGTEGCNTLMLNLTLRSPDERRLVVRRTVVDAYALQHPRSHCDSPTLLAGHLLGLCCAVERGGNLSLYSGMRGWLSRARDLPQPAPPAFLGEMTILDVARATSLDGHIETARKWAQCVWEAWYDHHDLVRGWISELEGR